MDPFEFSAPSRLDNEATGLEEGSDSWFAEPHMHLLRPTLSGPARRRIPPAATASSAPCPAPAPCPVPKSRPAPSSRPSGSARGEKRAGARKKDKVDVAALLAEHNAKFASKTVYEPRHHRVKDVRAWEEQSGKRYSALSMPERAEANREIAEMVRSHEPSGL